MVGPVIVNQGRVVRPSQLIRSVRRTYRNQKPVYEVAMALQSASSLRKLLYRATVVVSALILAAVLSMMVSVRIWRHGRVVAEASFNPGVAPFTLTVRRVPVPVTDSGHFICELRRGEYPVTSFRFFWIGYTPTRVTIFWPTLNHITISFDDKYLATCDWHWGRQAVWAISSPAGALTPGEEP